VAEYASAVNQSQPSNYQSYVVRLWREGPTSPWRATVRCALTGEQKQFASLEGLMAYLHDKTAEADKRK
jgi:hypothetical protein